MAKIIRISARPSRAARSRQISLNQHGAGIRSQMFFLKPSVTRVPVKIVSRKPAPWHVHTSHYFDGLSSVLEVLDNALAAGLPITLTNH